MAETGTGGTYQWSTTSSKVSLSNTAQATVTVTAVSASTSRNDVPIKVTYTVNGQSSTWNGTLTVVKPSSLTVTSTALNPTGFDCSVFVGLNCRSYLRTIEYVIKDQFGDTFGPWNFHARESFTSFSSDCAGVTSPTPSSLVLQGVGFLDGFSLCTTSCPQCDPNATGCTAKATQTWFVNGFSVRTNSVTWKCSDATVQQQ